MEYCFKLNYSHKANSYVSGKMNTPKDLKAGMIVELKCNKKYGSTADKFAIVLQNRLGNLKLYRGGGKTSIQVSTYGDSFRRTGTYDYLSIVKVLPSPSIQKSLPVYYNLLKGLSNLKVYFGGLKWLTVSDTVAITLDGRATTISIESARALKELLYGLNL